MGQYRTLATGRPPAGCRGPTPPTSVGEASPKRAVNHAREGGGPAWNPPFLERFRRCSPCQPVFAHSQMRMAPRPSVGGTT